MAPIHDACENNDLSEVRRLLDQDDSLKDLGDVGGRTPLMYCAVYGRLECLKLLRERGADVNRKDNDGATAAHYAAFYGKLECLQYLVEHCGADVTVKSNVGKTPLDYAREEGRQSCVKYLVGVSKHGTPKPTAPPPAAPAQTSTAPAAAADRPASATKRLPTPRKLGAKPMGDWDEDECIAFLKSVCRYSEYEDKFRSEGIRGVHLMNMDDAMLKEDLGIEKRLHRIGILEEIAKMKPADEGSSDAGTRGGRSAAQATVAQAEAAVASQGYRHKRALIVGINAYLPELKMKPLKNAVNDANRLAAALKKIHFADKEIKLLLNKDATKANITDALYDLADYDERDLIVIAFFCHGLKKMSGEKDCGFIVPADAKSDKPSQLYPVEEFEARVKTMKTHHILMLCDFCYSGTAAQRSNDVPAPTHREPSIVQNHLTKFARWVISSGSAEETVSDGKGNNSPFLELVATALEMDKFTAAQIYDYVMNNMGKGQTPLMNMLPMCSGHQMFLDLPALGDKLPANS